MGEILDLGVKAGVVEKSGSWFSYNSERIGQGRENAKGFLREHPDMTNQIEALIRQNAGLVSDAMMAGGPDDGSSSGADDDDGVGGTLKTDTLED
jgi:recombination protein RecA